MWGEMERSPALAAPGSNDYSGLIASSTSRSIGANADKVQGLTEKEESDLCQQYRPLILSLAARYSGKGIPFKELEAAGQLGLVRALRKCDPDRRKTFGAYAKQWVRGEMTALFKPNDDLFSLRRISITVWHNDDEKGHQRDVAADAPVIAPDLSALSERERFIFDARFSGETLGEVGKRLGISAERVRQVEARARPKIKGTSASEAISELTQRGDSNVTIRHPEERVRRWVEFRDSEPPKHIYREPRPSRQLARHRVFAAPLATMRGGEPLRNPNGPYGGPVIHTWGR
jgi:RNA polymerase sigma factor (sigma-70 family)